MMHTVVIKLASIAYFLCPLTTVRSFFNPEEESTLFCNKAYFFFINPDYLSGMVMKGISARESAVRRSGALFDFDSE